MLREVSFSFLQGVKKGIETIRRKEGTGATMSWRLRPCNLKRGTTRKEAISGNSRVHIETDFLRYLKVNGRVDFPSHACLYTMVPMNYCSVSCHCFGAYLLSGSTFIADKVSC